MSIFNIIDQNQPLSMNAFMETTTPIPGIFRLEGLFMIRNISLNFVWIVI
jgi:hypothetical protein